MFIYFNENKLAYHKGQLAPFFIAFIIIIIIAALVTINIGKVAKTKTYSANAADAGVLAAASTMASAFNYIAVANSNMMVNYEYFFKLATVSFIIGYIAMAVAIVKTLAASAFWWAACVCQKCCPDPPHFSCCACYAANCASAYPVLTTAIGSVKLFNQTMVALLVQVTGYWMLQFFFYKMIRDNVDDYHQSAIDTGHSFAFNNSGISTKLTDDQREDYKDWLKANVRDIPNASILTYSWLDGQGRSHDVANQVIIDPVEDYNLTHTMFLFPLEIATLTTALTLGGKALADLLSSEYMGCEYPCTAGTFADLAIPFEGWGLAVSAVAHFGIEDNGTFGSSSGNDAWPYIITWIDSVPHNRLVDVYQTQRHQGADLGAWSTEYPLTTSSARASFAGTGAIYSPDPHHDATMILTDFLTSHLLGNLAEPIKDVEGEIQAGLIGNEEEEEEEDED